MSRGLSMLIAMALSWGLCPETWAGEAGMGEEERGAVTELLRAGRAEPLLVAHRGVSARFPENTIAAFVAAVEDGAAMLELDVGLSADGEVVVLHDATLDRTTDGQGMLSEQTLALLKGLDAGAWFDPRFVGERLPTLAEVYDAVGQRIAINVEIKREAVRSTVEGGIEEKVIALTRERDLENRIVVSSFDPGAVARVKRLAPEVRAGVLYGHEVMFDPADLVSLFGADGLHMNKRHVTETIVRQLHERGFWVGAYTANEPEDLLRLKELGVDAIFTDDVAAARRTLGAAHP